ncbi:glycosyltransferase family 2 protein [Chryseobacterium sp. RG1]|uniref:Glycosyltransferase family 2 protein n=1 Tax=Chryseobacterium tagetis TaxID=2801334 RepID=A0ABS8A8L5_9FLAO|nr:glycosyltransferase family 2 protein [Chryseobacterium tagetis]MCA6069106.1 glycosyltransferase family 2 protein [Chryseobacterium tagetis]
MTTRLNQEIKLAIIIPAYKSTYLAETLQSLANQTNQNFRVYIGDDCSPYYLEDIVINFYDKLNIIYHKFENNLGAESLVKQWERCIDLCNEEYIWLFSDDDIASSQCVEAFYEKINNDNLKLMRFYTKIIDESGKIIPLYFDKTNIYKNISAEKFISLRLSQDRFRSYVVEYIFHRSIYQEVKFQNFQLAWFSDDAFWLEVSIFSKGISIIPQFVFWRFSGQNISSISNNSKVADDKILATKQYLKHLLKLLKKYPLNLKHKDLLTTLMLQYKNLYKNINISHIENICDEVGLNITTRDIIEVERKLNERKIFKILRSLFKI